MIVTEHNIRDIIATIPTIRINENVTEQPKFHWGDEKELNRYVQLKKDAAYPLIWLLPSPDDYKGRGQEVEKNCEFIIATRETREDLYNDQRYRKSFDVILNPLTDYLIHGLNVSSISDLMDQQWRITKFPNYSNAGENITIDLWDAVKLIIKVRFTDSNNCLRPISYDEL